MTIGGVYLTVLLGLPGIVFADNLGTWRQKLVEIKLLAENDFPRAEDEAKRLQEQVPDDATPADRVRLMNLQARISLYLGQTDQAAAEIDQAFRMAEQYGDRVGQVEADLSRALNTINQARIDQMSEAAVRAMTRLEGLDLPDLMAEAMLRVSMMYRRLEQLDDSVAIAVQALDFAQRTGHALALAYAYQAMATAYDANQRREEALEHYRLMREQAVAAHSKRLEAEALLGIGNIAIGMGDFSGGDAATQQAIAVFRDMRAPFYIARALFALADSRRLQGRIKEAVALLDESAELYRLGHNKIGLWWALNTRSGDYLTLGNKAAAQADAEQAYRLAGEIDFPLYLGKSAKSLAVLAAAHGEYRRAYALMAEADAMASKAAADKASTRMVDLARHYQNQIEQRQIEALNSRNERQQAEILRRGLQQRWFWTVGGAILAVLGVSLSFLLRLQVLNRRLNQANSQLQATLAAIPDLMIEVDVDGRYCDCHSSRPELLSQPRELLLGRTVSETLPAEAAEICLKALREAARTGSAHGAQLLLPLPGGDRWFELSVAAKSASEGEKQRLIVLSRDITDRKQAEIALQAREREFRTLAENIPDHIVRYDIQVRMTFMNTAAERLMGIGPAEPLGKTRGDASPENGATNPDAFVDTLKSVLEDGEPRELEFTVRHAVDGMKIHNIKFVAERDEEGNIVGALVVGRDITAQHDAESELKERERRYREIFENVTDALSLVEVTPEGRFRNLAFNFAYEQIMGVDRSELIGLDVGGVVAENDAERWESLVAKYRRCLKAGSTIEEEICLEMSTGRRHFHSTLVPLFDEAGRVCRILSIANDVTELKRAEREFRMLAENAPDNICRYDTQGRVVYVNPRFEATLGLKSAQLQGLTPLDLWPDGRYADYHDKVLSVAKTGQDGDIHIELAENGGGVRYCHVRFVAERDISGRIVGVLAMGRDISDIKRATAQIQALNLSLEQRVVERTSELRQQTLYLRTIIDTLPLLVWLKDTESRFVMVNQATAASCDLSAEQMIGKSDFDLWPRELAETYVAEDGEVMATRHRKIVEESLAGSQGTVWIEVDKVPVIDEDGSVLGTVGVARNISERKALDAAREKALAEAMRLVRIRSEFIARMSHELRTPLNGILGYAQLLQRQNGLDERQASMLAVIHQSGEHLLGLINDILDFAKIEAGKQSLNHGVVALTDFLRNLAGIAGVRAEQKQLAFRYEIGGGVPKLICTDEIRLRQILLNLLANAIQYSERGGVELRVSMAGGDRVRFEVEDTGIGIAEEQLENIFLPFEQADGGKGSAGGTGLGLAISRELVRLLGSELRVASRLGEGSRFWFDLEPRINETGDFASAEASDHGADSEFPAQGDYAGGVDFDLPPASEMQVLHRMALEGSMRDIIGRSAYLIQLDERYRPFAERIRTLAESYQSKALLALVERNSDIEKAKR